VAIPHGEAPLGIGEAEEAVVEYESDAGDEVDTVDSA
jgi:hypothetical protein